MTEADALQALAMRCAASSEPTLTGAELLDALRAGTLADAGGRAPSDPDWTPTYDLNRATVAGWEIKAGKAASDFGFSDVEGRYDRQQVVEQCQRMAEMYRRKIVSVVTLGSAT